MNKFNFKSNFLIKLILLSLIFLTSMVIFIDILVDSEYKKNMLSIENNFKMDLDNKNEYIQYRFREVQKDLMIMKELLNKTDIQYNKDNIEKLFKELIEHKDYYSQVRYINENGKEKIRLNKLGNGLAYIVTDSALQNKEDSYYFSNSIAMEENEIFVSPLDLNVENGGVTIPYKPTVRFSTVIFDEAHKKIGVLIFDYLGETFLNDFQLNSNKCNSKFFLTNKDGYYLKHPDKAKEFSFMFETRSSNLNGDFPELKNEIEENPELIFENEKGMFIYQRIFPLKNTIDKVKLDSQNYYWNGIIYISNNQLEELKTSIRKDYVENNLHFIIFGLLGIIVLSYSLTLNQEYKFNLRKNANYDNMTKLYNRRMAMKILKEEIKRYMSIGTDLTIMYLDLDNLKVVNDKYGHNIGDDLIIEMGNILLKVIRKDDIAARIGGDEYLIILPNCKYRNALKVKSRIKSQIKDFNKSSTGKFELSVSIGIKEYEDSLTYNEFIQEADKKMYEEKNKSKNKGVPHE